LLGVAFTWYVAGISKGGHFGGGLMGLLLILPFDYLRRGRMVQKIAAAAVIACLMLVGAALSYRSLGKMGPVIDRVATSAEIDRFNNDFMPAIREATGPAEDLYDQMTAMLKKPFDDRDEKELQAVYRALPKQRQSLEKVEQKLQQVGAFQSRRVEEARTAALELIDAFRQYFDAAEKCLRKGKDCNQEEEDREVTPKKTNLKDAYRKWKKVLQG
jgi:hypothetical protein